jgi:hypothetical protein
MLDFVISIDPNHRCSLKIVEAAVEAALNNIEPEHDWSVIANLIAYDKIQIQVMSVA